MFDVGDSLRAAFASAQRQLAGAQTAVVRANAGAQSGRQADAAMAQTARAALFTEALIGIERSRLTALKSVTK